MILKIWYNRKMESKTNKKCVENIKNSQLFYLNAILQIK